MSYVRLPPTVSKIQAANKYQREYLLQCKQQILKYQQWCPQLTETFADLCQIINVLSRDIDAQDALIKQRIQLQSALVSHELNKTNLCVPSNAAPTRIPETIWLPSLEEYKTHKREQSAPFSLAPVTQRTNANNYVIPTSHQHPSKTSVLRQVPQTNETSCSIKPNTFPNDKILTGNNSHIALRRKTIHTKTPELHPRPRKAERFIPPIHNNDLKPWHAIPSHLKAFPSLLEQLIKLQNPVTTPIDWNNRFAPLFEEYYNERDPTELPEDTVMMTSTQATDDGSVMVPMTDEAIPPNPPARPSSLPEDTSEPIVTMDLLRHILDVPALDVTRLQGVSSQFDEAVQVVPPSIHKVRFEVNIKFSKNTSKMDRILSVFDVARRFDKNVCLCPSGKEPHPVLYGPKDIKLSRLHRYFQDKPGAQNGKNANNLYGFIVFGVSGEVDDFELAMRDWAIGQRHELVRHGVASNSLIAGFLVQISVTVNREECMKAIKNTPEWIVAGQPDFSIKISTLWSTGGAGAKVPALCFECDRTMLDQFVRMCEALFYGDNVTLPSAIRACVFFPSRIFAPNHQVRLTYITSQQEFLSNERTVTCAGLGDIYQSVRLRCDPSKRAIIEDVILRLTGISGPVLRSIDKTIDGKVFFKLDVGNLDAWLIRRGELGDFLRHAVHPEDHAVVFSNESQLLTYSDPWSKYTNGRLARNILEIPSQDSIDFANKCAEKLRTSSQTLGVKKRAHASVSSSSTPSTASLSTSSSSNLSQNIPIDLTGDSTPSESPTHKVQVVEQRPFQTSTSPISSIDGSSAAPTATESPSTARLQNLENKVAAHEEKLHHIQQSVTSLDSKLDQQHAESNFNFGKFATMLNNINNTIIAHMTPLDNPSNTPMQADHNDGSDFDPDEERRKWNMIWKQDMAHRDYVEAERVAFAEELRQEAEGKGQHYDYFAIACERFPSPPPVEYPDDVPYMEDYADQQTDMDAQFGG